VDHRRQIRPDGTTHDMRGESSRILGVQGLDDNLAKAPRATKLGPQAADGVAARHLIAPVGTNHQEGLLLEHGRKSGQKLERCVVGPLQVVQENRRRAIPGDRLERTTDGLEQCRTIPILGLRAELREDQG